MNLANIVAFANRRTGSMPTEAASVRTEGTSAGTNGASLDPETDVHRTKGPPAGSEGTKPARFVAFLVALFGLLVSVPAAIAQPVQWRVQDGGNGHWYEIRDMGHVSWTQARDLAVSAGGHLATLTSAAECRFVASLRAGEAIFGGYQDTSAPDYSEPSGGWRWVTGEPWQFTNWHSGSGEPNDGFGAGGENYLAFWRFGDSLSDTWNDVPNLYDDPVPFVAIEWDSTADCNGDGIFDVPQFANGQLFDANHNGVADTCGIAVQPVDQSVSVNVTVAFFVEITPAPACPAAVAFRWQRRDPAVHDANAPNAWIDIADAGAFLNSGTAGLLITHPIPALATGYRCKLTGGCGCETTYTNTVNFSVACPADFNADGAVDFFDYDDFVRAFEAGC